MESCYVIFYQLDSLYLQIFWNYIQILFFKFAVLFLNFHLYPLILITLENGLNTCFSFK